MRTLSWFCFVFLVVVLVCGLAFVEGLFFWVVGFFVVFGFFFPPASSRYCDESEQMLLSAVAQECS